MMTDEKENQLGTRPNDTQSPYKRKKSLSQKMIKILLVIIIIAVFILVVRVVKYTKKNLPPSTAILPVPSKYLEPEKEVNP
jgi:flagellar basal body-associated protein FliL